MSQYLLQLIPSSPKLTLMGVVDILVVAFLIYELILIVRGTRAAHILLGILTIFVIYNLSLWLRLDLLHSILSYAMPYMAIAVIVLFQSEIRRTLARIGRKRPFGRAFRRRESTEEILLALGRLSSERTGALMFWSGILGYALSLKAAFGSTLTFRGICCSASSGKTARCMTER